MPRSQLHNIAKVVMELDAKSSNARIKVRGADGSYIEIDKRELREAMQVAQGPLTFDKLAFSESYQYLENAKTRFNTKTPEGYSNCKADCRNALMSTLETLTGMNTIKEAAKELHRQGILGEREEEFTRTFDSLLGILHGIDSKKGSHPPMERSEDDAKLALNITTSVIDYIVNQCTRPRV